VNAEPEAAGVGKQAADRAVGLEHPLPRPPLPLAGEGSKTLSPATEGEQRKRKVRDIPICRSLVGVQQTRGLHDEGRAGGYRLVSRSKPLTRIANAAPNVLGHPKVAARRKKLWGVWTLILALPVSDVLANHRLGPTHCREEIRRCPRVLTDEVALALAVHPRQVDGRCGGPGGSAGVKPWRRARQHATHSQRSRRNRKSRPKPINVMTVSRT
jgi:hypothetical protein